MPPPNNNSTDTGKKKPENKKRKRKKTERIKKLFVFIWEKELFRGRERTRESPSIKDCSGRANRSRERKFRKIRGGGLIRYRDCVVRLLVGILREIAGIGCDLAGIIA